MLDWMTLHNPVERLDQCVACRTARTEMQGFTISAQFRHDATLVEGALPLILCSGCVNVIAESLSPESRKVWQEFVSEYFEGPDSEDFDLDNFGIF